MKWGEEVLGATRVVAPLGRDIFALEISHPEVLGLGSATTAERRNVSARMVAANMVEYKKERKCVKNEHRQTRVGMEQWVNFGGMNPPSTRLLHRNIEQRRLLFAGCLRAQCDEVRPVV